MKVRSPRTASAAVLATGCCIGLLLAGCGASRPHTTTQSAAAAKPLHTIALPAGVRSATPVEPNGYVWVLARSGTAATLTQVQLSNGGKAATVPVSENATAVAQSPTGRIVVGTRTATAGSVSFFNAAAQRPLTVPVGAPVEDVAYGTSGNYLYVLNGTSKSRSVTVIDSATRKTTTTVGLPANTVSIAPNASETDIWSVSASGTVDETQLSSHKIVTTLSVGSPGISVALAPSGNTLYVLKGTAAKANVAVVTTATSSITKVLPAAADSVDLGVSVNSNQLYDFVGTPKFGNVQIYNVP